MKALRRLAGIASISLLGALAAGAPVSAGATSGQAQVGVPGCSDDVPVRATREAITFDSRGRSIRAHLYTPRGEANGEGIVLLHGGTGFEMNAILFDAHAIQLASRGYRVILPAYFDAAGPDARRRTVAARAWRQAALDAAEALAAEPGMARARVALWGYSRGAAVGADAATSEGGGVRSAILVAGGGAVEADLTGRGLSVLMLHARVDEAVPVRATLRLAEDLRDAGAAVEVQELAFDGHQYDLPTWCAAFRATRRFLESRREAVDGPA